LLFGEITALAFKCNLLLEQDRMGIPG